MTCSHFVRVYPRIHGDSPVYAEGGWIAEVDVGPEDPFRANACATNPGTNATPPTENQLIELREFAAKEGLTIVREYIDQKSGKNGDRPKFQAMMKAAADPNRDFDMVLFWRLDRFSREGVLETLQHLQELSKHGVCWKSGAVLRHLLDVQGRGLEHSGVYREAGAGHVERAHAGRPGAGAPAGASGRAAEADRSINAT